MENDVKKYQACAPETQFFGEEAFKSSSRTSVRWLGNAGVFLNSRGTCIMIDPLLKDFDMPLLIEMPIKPEAVPHLDAVLITHNDNDHYSKVTCTLMAPICTEYHTTQYVAELMVEDDLPAIGHDINETFEVGPVRITLTPADHAWPNAFPGFATRVFCFEDYCGFWMETPDGTLWMPGDSRLLAEHLEMPTPDAILMDFSDSKWHIGLENAVKLADAYPNTPLLLIHWGTVDAPDMAEFNGDPEVYAELIINPNRIHVVAPGEPFILQLLNEACKRF